MYTHYNVALVVHRHHKYQLTLGLRGLKAIALFFCFLFYILATSKVKSGLVPTCGSAQLCRLHNTTPLGDQATGTMTQYPTQSYYPATEPSSPCPNS